MTLRFDTARIGGCGGPIPTDVFSFYGAILKVEGEVEVAGNIYLGGCVHDGSDRNSKENFTPVNSQDVLEKVVSLPITRWNYKKDRGTPHVGPMAQDFYAAFGLSDSDRYITQGDAQGVALAAIQGLYQIVQEKDKAVAELKQDRDKLALVVQQLQARMAELERAARR